MPRWALSCCGWGVCTGRLQDFFNDLHDNIMSSFLPRKQDVTDDYWEWLKWRLGQVRHTGALHTPTSSTRPPCNQHALQQKQGRAGTAAVSQQFGQQCNWWTAGTNTWAASAPTDRLTHVFALLCCACAVLCLQRFFSATLQNFATQSLLMAVGVGARKALAASAAINWMLKDGMNRLVRMGVATQFGESFDSDLKVCSVCVCGAGSRGAVGANEQA